MKHLCSLPIAALLAPLHASDPGAGFEITKRTWQGIPGLERTAKNRVFASWFSGGPKEPSPENTVLLCYSDDGVTWNLAPRAMST